MTNAAAEQKRRSAPMALRCFAEQGATGQRASRPVGSAWQQRGKKGEGGAFSEQQGGPCAALPSKARRGKFPAGLLARPRCGRRGGGGEGEGDQWDTSRCIHTPSLSLSLSLSHTFHLSHLAGERAREDALPRSARQQLPQPSPDAPLLIHGLRSSACPLASALSALGFAFLALLVLLALDTAAAAANLADITGPPA
jgi:hypothetical protein